MSETSVEATKPSDREYRARVVSEESIAWRFHEFRPSAETAHAARSEQTMCIDVIDYADLCHAK